LGKLPQLELPSLLYFFSCSDSGEKRNLGRRSGATSKAKEFEKTKPPKRIVFYIEELKRPQKENFCCLKLLGEAFACHFAKKNRLFPAWGGFSLFRAHSDFDYFLDCIHIKRESRQNKQRGTFEKSGLFVLPANGSTKERVEQHPFLRHYESSEKTLA